ncbi:MAG TPA: Ig-like domain-containing protein, partial [Verrucomicrobiae bacterium]
MKGWSIWFGVWLGVGWLSASSGRADSWSPWNSLFFPGAAYNGAGLQLAANGTYLYAATYFDGIYRASGPGTGFTGLPLTGFPLYDATTNTTGLAVTAIAVTDAGAVVIAGSPVQVTTNQILFNPPGGAQNTLPVFYWWDETNQLWQAAGITGKTYPYTGNTGNFSVAPDGSIWACSGFASYVYRSTDGGQNYTAFDINARVPAGYLPFPFNPSQTSFGEVFSICAGWQQEVVIGTETGGYLHSTNNGQSWVSLDPNFTNAATVNPLGRIGDARVAGQDHYGNFLCGNFQMGSGPGQGAWGGVHLIGWRPFDGTYFEASSGLATNVGGGRIYTTPAGSSWIFLNQNYLLQGGIFRSPHGRDWIQFNQGSGADQPFAPGLTNILARGDVMTAWSNLVYVAVGNEVFTMDTTLPPVLNRPPVGWPQNVAATRNTALPFTLAGTDAEGDSLHFTVLTYPVHGTLTGTPPDLVYTPTNNFTGIDALAFQVDDGQLFSSPAYVNFAINPAGSALANVNLTAPVNGSSWVTPGNLRLTATATDPSGIARVMFYVNSTLLVQLTNAPYTYIWTNPPVGDFDLSARAVSAAEVRTWAAPVRVSVLGAAPKLTIQGQEDGHVRLTWP